MNYVEGKHLSWNDEGIITMELDSLADLEPVALKLHKPIVKTENSRFSHFYVFDGKVMYKVEVEKQ